MRRLVLATALLATLAAAAVVVAVPHATTLVTQAYVGFLALAAISACLQMLASSYRPARPPERTSVARTARDPIAAELERLHRQIELATTTAADLHAFGRPMLREIAVPLLLLHNVDLDREPGRARRLLGQDLWELVRPNRPRPSDPDASGLSTQQLALLVDRLEAL
jgi:hypothetical protein